MNKWNLAIAIGVAVIVAFNLQRILDKNREADLKKTRMEAFAECMKGYEPGRFSTGSSSFMFNCERGLEEIYKND